MLHVVSAAQDVASTATVWAADPSPSPSPIEGPSLNTNGILAFIATKVAPILLAAIGVIFISRANKGEMGRMLTSSSIVIMGIVFIVGGVALFAFGRGLVDLIFPGSNP